MNAPPKAQQANNDNRLMELWNLFKHAEAEVGALLTEVKRVSRHHGPGVALDEAKADAKKMRDRCLGLQRAIIETPADSLPGAAVHARLMVWLTSDNPGTPECAQATRIENDVDRFAGDPE